MEFYDQLITVDCFQNLENLILQGAGNHSLLRRMHLVCVVKGCVTLFVESGLVHVAAKSKATLREGLFWRQRNIDPA